MDWYSIKKLHLKPPSFQMKRIVRIQKAYNGQNAKIKSLGISSSDYIKRMYLQDNHYSVIPNKFPYDVKKFIEHWCIWWNPDYPIDSNLHSIHYQSVINKILEKYFGYDIISGKDYIYFENEMKNRSIPGIRHIHVFINKEIFNI